MDIIKALGMRKINKTKYLFKVIFKLFRLSRKKKLNPFKLDYKL